MKRWTIDPSKTDKLQSAVSAKALEEIARDPVKFGRQINAATRKALEEKKSSKHRLLAPPAQWAGIRTDTMD